MPGRLRVMAVGDLAATELRPVVAALAELAPGVERRDVRQLADARALLRSGWFPDLAVACHRYPEEFPSGDVLAALSEAPLARWVACLGAWCESAVRTGIAWPQAACVPARGCEERIAAELIVLRGEAPPLPLTASRDEVFAFDAEGAWRGAEAANRVGVVSPDRAFAECLADICRGGGGCETTIVARPGDESDRALPGCDVIVWDVDPWRSDSLAELAELSRRAPLAFLVAVMGIAHPEDVAALEAAGARAVIPSLSAATRLRAVLRRANVPGASREAGARGDEPDGLDGGQQETNNRDVAPRAR